MDDKSVRNELQDTIMKGLEEKKNRRTRNHKKHLNKTVSQSMSLDELLTNHTKNRLMEIARVYSVKNYTDYNKEELASELNNAINENLQSVVNQRLRDDERQALRSLYQQNGLMNYGTFTDEWGSEFDDSVSWYYGRPVSVLGRLQLFGLAHTGTTEADREIVLLADSVFESLKSLDFDK